jgi:hypothetical protein
MSRTYNLIPIGGLCNRLRAIISHYSVCERDDLPLHVYWYPNSACPATFSQLFDVTRLPPRFILHDGTDRPPLNHIQTCYSHYSVSDKQISTLASTILFPTPAIQGKIDSLLAALGSVFTALHIRRTDHNTNYHEDAEYVRFASAGTERVYVAADNPMSVATVKKALGERVVWGSKYTRKSTDSIRLTDVEDAVVDLWVCSQASRFRGTFYSSFSEWIEGMRSVLVPSSTFEAGVLTRIAEN